MSLQLQPWDEANQELVAQTHPADWQNPQPAERYNLVVVGAGTAGLVAAAGAAGLGARVALVERGLLGGDCLNVGCVPSKALIRAARCAAEVRTADEFGVRLTGELSVDFPAVMLRMRQLRAGISPHDSVSRFTKLGVDVFLGDAGFTGPQQLEVGGQTLRFSKAIIATGGRAAPPPIAGLDEINYLTNETIFELTTLPRRLGVIGGGPIGCELAQTFARFGSEVTLVSTGEQLLPRDEPTAAACVEQALRRDGVNLLLGRTVQSVEPGAEGKLLELGGDSEQRVEVDEILVATGRRPNVEGLGLAAAGVEFTATGVTVSDRLQTSNKRIYAAGDVCTKYKFTHAADALARVALQNALFPGRAKASALVIPWCTYTSPEVARVGLSEAEAKDRGIRFDIFEQSLSQVDRAILDGATEGFTRVLVKAGTDKILGATIVAEHAGDLIPLITFAMNSRQGLKAIAGTIFPYPTQAEAVKRTADAYNRTRLKPWLKRLFELWFRWTR